MHRKHFLILFAVTLMTGAFVWVRLNIVSTSYEINALAKTEKDLRDECNSLTLKINEAKSPQKLVQLATGKFGLKNPRADQVILIRK